MTKQPHGLIPLRRIKVPRPRPDRHYRLSFSGQSFSFRGLKRLLAAADLDKAGDRNAGLAAPSEVSREAARSILSGLTLEHLFDHPLTDDRGGIDSVMRVNYAIDPSVFASIATLTLGEFKELLLRSNGLELRKLGRGLTGVMAAAVAKLMDVHELIFVARKIHCPTRARTRLGLPGTLSSRLQPNHPTDDPRGLSLLIYAGLSLGSGDALLGVNPATDTVENVTALLRQLDQIRQRTKAPTQICVLSHIKTQLTCLKHGAPVEIMFQSLAGTENTLLTEFDVSIDLLDRACETMARKGPLKDVAEQAMYFETGQGSEFSYGKHNGIDMTTTEALCYGLARRYDPFMVNNVTGFIGPETHLDNSEMILSNLQDHFMGKLLGLPMGMAPCYTLHSRITLEGQQVATELLAAAGANYYMDVCLNTDRMLAYFDTSGHDDQTLREIHGKRTTPEYAAWAISEGIFEERPGGELARGPAWGNARRFCETDLEYSDLVRTTPVFPEFRHAGPRPSEAATRAVRLNQAWARNAVQVELDQPALLRLARFRIVETLAKTREDHLSFPDRGSQLSPGSARRLKAEGRPIQIVVSDGLSASAVHANISELFPVLMDGFKGAKLRIGRPILARHGRVKLAEEIARRLKSEVLVLLIGERPGGDAAASLSLSAYLVFQLRGVGEREKGAAFSGNDKVRFEYTVISNIHPGGMPALEAGSVIVEKTLEILAHRAAGNRLEALMEK